MQTVALEPELNACRRTRTAGWLERLPGVNWYQVAVVALTTFAVAMDLMFPPCRAALANGLSLYVGHVFWSPSVRAVVQLDVVCLGAELAAILLVAIVGWKLGPAERRRNKR
jgi:hypothetical protein